jgi:imidazolonepropionase
VTRLFHNISELATPCRVIRNAAIAVDAGVITWCGAACDWAGQADAEEDLGSCAVIPALIDPHTHAVWAGDRLADFEQRACGVGYEAILARGGGIRSTIAKTAAAPLEDLVALALPRVEALLHSGAATIEVKSGYGFTVEAELRMLEAIRELGLLVRARLIPTLLIHVPPTAQPDRADYVAAILTRLIPQAATQRLAQAVDVFVEKEAWSAEEAARFLQCARANGMKTKLHTEQFHRVGGLELGIREQVLSVDHLEACRPEQLSLLAGSHTVATILPGVSLHLGIPAAPGRALIDAGATVAIGTDLNPGSSPLYSMANALALAVRLNGLTPAEALQAGTVNAAKALGLEDRGRIEIGKRADLAVLHSSDWRDIVYSLGTNPVREVYVAGERL